MAHRRHALPMQYNLLVQFVALLLVFAISPRCALVVSTRSARMRFSTHPAQYVGLQMAHVVFRSSVLVTLPNAPVTGSCPRESLVGRLFLIAILPVAVAVRPICVPLQVPNGLKSTLLAFHRSHSWLAWLTISFLRSRLTIRCRRPCTTSTVNGLARSHRDQTHKRGGWDPVLLRCPGYPIFSGYLEVSLPWF